MINIIDSVVQRTSFGGDGKRNRCNHGFSLDGSVLGFGGSAGGCGFVDLPLFPLRDMPTIIKITITAAAPMM